MEITLISSLRKNIVTIVDGENCAIIEVESFKIEVAFRKVMRDADAVNQGRGTAFPTTSS